MYITLPSGDHYVLEQPTLAHDFVVPSQGNFVQAVHDYRTGMFDKNVRQAATQTEVPETVHLIQTNKIENINLTENIAEFVLATMRVGATHLSREQAVQIYHEFTRQSVCLTDGHAWDTGEYTGIPDESYHCVLTGVNPTNKLMQLKITIAFGGNVYKKISGTTVEAIDYLKPLPDPAQLYKDKPWLFQWLTQCYMEQIGTEFYNGKMIKRYKVSRGPHFRPVGTLLPLFGAGGTTRFAERWRITPIANNQVYSPYIP